MRTSIFTDPTRPGRSILGGLLLTGCAVLAAPTVALASPDSGSAAPAATGSPSVEGYLCTFAGECGGRNDAPSVSRDAPATKGFRLARAAPVALTPATPSKDAPATRGFRLARATATPGEQATSAMPHLVKPIPASAARGTRRATRSDALAMVTPRRPAVENGGQGIAGTSGARRADLSIGFEFGSDKMTAAGLSTAQIFEKSLVDPVLHDKRFLIEGHTDSSGVSSRNLDLSRRRAQAVADYLIAQGIDANRLEVKGSGSEHPLPGHASSDPANRRVEAQLIS